MSRMGNAFMPRSVPSVASVHCCWGQHDELRPRLSAAKHAGSEAKMWAADERLWSLLMKVVSGCIQTSKCELAQVKYK